MSLITDRRAELKRAARKRHKEVVPRLRKSVKDARTHRTLRLKKVRAHCKVMMRKHRETAARQRDELRARIAKAKAKAQEICKRAKASASESELDKLDRAIAALLTEREAIADLRARARRLKDPRGRAGGKAAADRQRDSDDFVRAELEDDPVKLALFDRVRGKIKAGPRRTRIEAFFEWMHDHPDQVDAEQEKLHHKWALDAERMFDRLAKAPPADAMKEGRLRKWLAELNTAHDHLEAIAHAGDGW